MPRLKDGFEGERSVVLPPVVLDMLRADPVLTLLHITDIGYYPVARHHFRSRPEGTPQYVLIYCQSGHGEYCTGKGESRRVGPDQYFLLPPGEAHSYSADPSDPWTIYWLHFSGTVAAHLVPETGVTIDLKPAADSRISQRINLFEEIMSTLRGGFGTDHLRYASSLLHHFLASLRYLGVYRTAGSTARERDVMESTIHLMRENLHRSVTLDYLAGQAGLSASYFSARFKAHTGHAPLAYFNLLKMQHACHLLDSTDLHVKEISHILGIADQFYFSRLFSRTMGMSPAAYRGRGGEESAREAPGGGQRRR